MTKIKKKHKGIVLIYTIFVVLFITILVTIVFTQMQTGMFLTKNMTGETRAYWAALSGLEYAETMLNTNIYWPMNNSSGSTIGAYEITTNTTGENVEIYGKNNDTEDSFRILFSKKISTDNSLGYELPSTSDKRPPCPYSFNNNWYMMTNPSAGDGIKGKEIKTSFSPEHYIFIPAASEIYVSVQGISGKRICNLEKIYKTDLYKRRYPAAIYANNINIAVKEKFLVNEKGGRTPAIVCKNNFNISTERPADFNNTGSTPCFLQDGIIYTDLDTINISGQSFNKTDLTISEKYRVRIEKLDSFKDLSFQIPSPQGDTFSSTTITIIRIPYVYSKIEEAQTLEEIAQLISPDFIPPANAKDEYALLVGNNTLPAENFQEFIALTANESALLKRYEAIYDNIMKTGINPDETSDTSEDDVKKLKEDIDRLKAKAYHIEKGPANIFYVKEEAPSAHDLQVIGSHFSNSGQTVTFSGKASCSGTLTVKGGNFTQDKYVLSYALKITPNCLLSAQGDLVIEGGVIGSGTLLAENITINGPVKLNDKTKSYVGLYATEDININYDQKALGFRSEDIDPAWIASNFIIDYFSNKSDPAVFLTGNFANSTTTDEIIANILDGKTLGRVLAYNRFPVSDYLVEDYSNATLRQILTEVYNYTSAVGNNSPEGLVRQLHTSFMEYAPTFDKSVIYKFFDISPHHSSEHSSPAPLQMNSRITLAPSSNFRGIIYSGENTNINIDSGDFSLEGVILCGKTFTEQGLDNFIVRYDPSFSTIHSNPSIEDYKVSEILFNKF